MLLYAGFVGCGLFALWRELRSRVLFAAIALPVAAALCDAWENTLLFDIQTAFTLGDYSPAMASLPWPVAAKFILLAPANIAVGHRSEERRVGKECVSTCSTRWSPYL